MKCQFHGWLYWISPVVQSVSCIRLCDPMDCSSFVHGIFQARILGRVAISFSRGSSWPRDWTWVSCIGRQILYHWAAREAPSLDLIVTSWSLVTLDASFTSSSIGQHLLTYMKTPKLRSYGLWSLLPLQCYLVNKGVFFPARHLVCHCQERHIVPYSMFPSISQSLGRSFFPLLFSLSHLSKVTNSLSGYAGSSLKR